MELDAVKTHLRTGRALNSLLLIQLSDCSHRPLICGKIALGWGIYSAGFVTDLR